MQKFLSLDWYDSVIEFLFKLAAKTSEPALALGLTVSAADYLSHGAVMAGHPAFSLAWSWTQALALESSSGVVFVYALQSFKQTDKIKGGLYLALALMLAIVGGGMLLMQVNAVTMGSAESAIPVLNVLRVIVSIAYIFLLRAKHIRFTDLQDTREQAAAPVMPNIDELIERLQEANAAHITAILEQVALEQPRLPAIAEHAENREQIDEPIYPAQFASKEAEIAALVRERPGASVEEIADLANCTPRTAAKWIQKLR